MRKSLGNRFMTRSQELREGGLDSRLLRHVIIVSEERHPNLSADEGFLEAKK